MYMEGLLYRHDEEYRMLADAVIADACEAIRNYVKIYRDMGEYSAKNWQKGNGPEAIAFLKSDWGNFLMHDLTSGERVLKMLADELEMDIYEKHLLFGI